MLESYSKKLSNIDTKNYTNNKSNLYIDTKNYTSNKSNLYIDAGLTVIGKRIKENFGSIITLTNNKIKDVIKVIKSLENRWILLKGTTRKTASQEGEFLKFLRPSMAASLPLMKNVLPPIDKSVLLSFGLSAAISVTAAAIQNKTYGSGTTTLIITNKEMEDVMKIVKSLEELALLIKGIRETIRHEAKEQKGGLLGMTLGTLAGGISGNALTEKGVSTAGEEVIRAS